MTITSTSIWAWIKIIVIFGEREHGKQRGSYTDRQRKTKVNAQRIMRGLGNRRETGTNQTQ